MLTVTNTVLSPSLAAAESAFLSDVGFAVTGDSVGGRVGLEVVGPTVGLNSSGGVGTRVGRLVGLFDGAAVEGVLLGRSVGERVGAFDGMWVGENDGAPVGASVGDAVGLTVSPL